jgi:hypothetical protein
MNSTKCNHGSVVGRDRGMVEQRVPMVLPRDQGELGLLKVQRDRFPGSREQHQVPPLSFHCNLTSTDYGPRITSYVHGLQLS